MRTLHTYQKLFWIGFLHALSIALYCVCVTYVWLSLSTLLSDVASPAMSLVLFVFLTVISIAVMLYLIFFVPLKLIIHHQFKQATVLLVSTFGWLFIYFAIFVMALITTLYS